MIRRFPWWRTLLLGALCLVPAGCEPHGSWLRPKDDEDWMAKAAADSPEDDAKPRKVIGGNGEDVEARSFFKNNRRSGAWSSEAREIESHLGAN